MGRRRPRAGRTLALLAVAAGVALAAACGDDPDTSAGPPRTSAPSSPARPTTTTATEVAPTFRSAVTAVSAADLTASWRPGCPVPVEDLRAVDATHWGFDGEPHDGRIVVAADRADDLVGILEDLFDARYPIERMDPVDAYGGDDIASVLANNTSAFNCRYATGSTSRWSEHAYGRAVDLNPRTNPYVTSSGAVVPEETAPFADRSRTDAGMIRDGDPAVTAFRERGWVWGGDWTTAKDYQHFSTTGR